MNRRDFLASSMKAVPAIALGGAMVGATPARPRSLLRVGRHLVGTADGSVVYLVDWDDRYAFCDDVLGRDGGKPQEHPDDPTRFAKAVALRGIGPVIDIDPLHLRYKSALVAIEYAVPGLS
jgi:hypothetical protein